MEKEKSQQIISIGLNNIGCDQSNANFITIGYDPNKESEYDPNKESEYEEEALPELETDRALRNPRYAAGGTLCGIMMRDGLVPFADCVSTAQGQNRLSAVGAVIGIGAAAICMLLMAYLCFVFVPIDARPIRVLLYAILCFVPIFFLESGVGRD